MIALVCQLVYLDVIAQQGKGRITLFQNHFNTTKLDIYPFTNNAVHCGFDEELGSLDMDKNKISTIQILTMITLFILTSSFCDITKYGMSAGKILYKVIQA